MPKSSYLRAGIQRHLFSNVDLERPNGFFLNVYSIDPGVNVTWDIPTPVFAPYQVNSINVNDNQIKIVDEITLGPVVVGQNVPLSHFVLFGRYGNSGSYEYRPLHIGTFRVARTIPEGDFILLRSNSLVITEI